MWNWNKVFTDGELKYLLKQPDKMERFVVADFVNASDALMDDFIGTFGLSRKFKRYHKLRVEVFNLKRKYIMTGDRFLINVINTKESEIEEIRKILFQGSKLDFDKQFINIQKWYGQKIDLKTTTVKEFHVIQEQYVTANKKRPNSRRGGTR
jgi:hypothetical protein